MQERAGFEAFVGAHATSLLRTAWLLTGSGADAEDLLQGSLTRLWVKWPKVSEASNQLAYGRTTLVRVHANGRRLKRSTERPVAEVGDSPQPSRMTTTGASRRSWRMRSPPWRPTRTGSKR